MTTLGQIIADAQDMLGEVDDEPERPVSGLAWKRLVKSAADTLCRDTHCLYRTYEMDLVKGQSDYCAPPLYHITKAGSVDKSGTPLVLRPLPASHTVYADGYSEGGYTLGTPRAFTSLGANRIRVFATPSYGTTGAPTTTSGSGNVADLLTGGLATDTVTTLITGGLAGTQAVTIAGTGIYGLVMEGFGVCGDLWDALSDRCPLPDRAIDAILNFAASKRSAQLKDYTGAKYYMELYLDASGSLEAEIATALALARRQGYSGFALPGGVLSSGGSGSGSSTAQTTLLTTGGIGVGTSGGGTIDGGTF